jgi:glutamate synthase domain-containing protein 2
MAVADHPVTGVLSLLGLFDLLQSRHAVRRNYPILGNIRYLVEGIRPEIRQYLLESDSDALPFSRAQRSLVYSRAKNETADNPSAPDRRVQSGFEFIGHSMRPAPWPTRQFPRHRRRPAMHPAVFGVDLQHFGHELRLAQRQRHPRAEPGRQTGQLRP